MSALLSLLLPYEFSPTVLLCCLGCGLLYLRGVRARRRTGERTGVWRSLSFFVGLILMYVVLQTHFDYVSQHMFWVHRLQHLVLHHLAPFLIMLAAPQVIMARGMPTALRERVMTPLWHNPLTQGLYRTVQYPLVACTLFVGLIYFWLTPSIHFDAMLSVPLYLTMNWGMAIDGLLFWWLIVNPAPREAGGMGFGARILMLWAVALPQIYLGAHIALSPTELFDVYAVCGRAWPVPPLEDQQIGGLITWIPAAMMSVLAALVVMRLWMHDNGRQLATPVRDPALSAEPRG